MRPTSDSALLLHGQPGTGRDWDAVRAAVGGRISTLAIDRPGWDGRSAARDLAGNVAAAVAALDQRGIERTVVAGHSLGGAVAAWLAAEHPDRVSGLVLIAPSASCASLNRLDELLATPILGSALATGAFLGIGLTLQLGRARQGVTAKFGLPEDYLRGYGQLLLNPLTWHSFGVEQRMLLRELPALEQRLPGISAPTTIVIGTADRIVTPASARGLSGQIPGARLVELDRACHLLLQERPGEVAELIVSAVQDASRDRPSELAAQDSPGSG